MADLLTGLRLRFRPSGFKPWLTPGRTSEKMLF